MPTTRKMTVTLPEELADRVREKVASGEYESEAAVIRDGLEAIEDDHRRFESWLRDEVVPALEALDADPSRALSIEDLETMLDEEYERSVAMAG